MSDLAAVQEGDCPTLDRNFDRNFGEVVDWVNSLRASGNVNAYDLGAIAAAFRRLFFLNTYDAHPDYDNDQLEEEWQRYFVQPDDNLLGEIQWDGNGSVWPTQWVGWSSS